MKTIKILVGCESSQTTTKAFRDLGFEAYSCDLLPAEWDARYHYQGDVREALKAQDWDLFIVHPSCTYLTNSAAWAYTDGPYHQKIKAGTPVGAERRALREEALDFVREMMSADVPHIALENPMGVIGTRIDARDYGFSHAKASQYIQPYDFGDDASKKTGLWLKNLPALQSTKYINPRIVNGKKRWGNQTDSGQNKLSPSDNRWKERSKTYQGWADAMAQQWGKFLADKYLGE